MAGSHFVPASVGLVWGGLSRTKWEHIDGVSLRVIAALADGKEHPYFALMITSKLTSKAQTTIPQPVRSALRLRAGDEIAYAIEEGRVVLTRAHPGEPADDPFKTFSEWDGPADTEAYAGL